MLQVPRKPLDRRMTRFEIIEAAQKQRRLNFLRSLNGSDISDMVMFRGGIQDIINDVTKTKNKDLESVKNEIVVTIREAVPMIEVLLMHLERKGMQEWSKKYTGFLKLMYAGKVHVFIIG